MSARMPTILLYVHAYIYMRIYIYIYVAMAMLFEMEEIRPQGGHV